MKTGRRVSKGLKSNQYGNAADNKGNVYYEYRPNRIDVKQPKRKQTYPKLADGGMMAKGGKMFPHKMVLVKPDGEQLDVATFAGKGDAYSCANHLTNSNGMGYTYKVVSKKADGGELHRTEE
jgi:hypothetical protein